MRMTMQASVCRSAPGRRAAGLSAAALVALLTLSATAQPGLAGPVERARRIHDRIVGIPPTPQRLDEMITALQDQGAYEAALIAIEHPVFYSSTLKNFVTPWTNVEQTVFAPLNDYSATVIGMVRDDVPFNTLLSADLVYVGRNGVVPTAYSPNNNFHYEQLEANRVDLGNRTDFVPVAQSSLPGSQLGPNDAAGIITTRAAGKAFFSAGTNRRMLRFLAINHLCRDMEDLHDPSLPADRVRQDVSRSPGGDSSLYLNSCVGCHDGMDPMAGAFAYFDWQEGNPNDPNLDGRVIHTAGQVQAKYLQNGNVFPYGYVTTSNRWDNYWREGRNSLLGWAGTTPGGFGPKSMGAEIANSRAFALCQVEKVFRQVCFRPDSSQEDRDAIEAITDAFMQDGYRLKGVFARVADYCTLPDAN